VADSCSSTPLDWKQSPDLESIATASQLNAEYPFGQSATDSIEVTIVFFVPPLKKLKNLHALIRRQPSRSTRPAAAIRPRLEPLECRLTPAVAHISPFTLRGVAGNVSLSNAGILSFTPTAPGKAQVLDAVCSAFNVDAGNNLWYLESGGNLSEIVSGAKPKTIRRDVNVGAFSLSASGVAEEVKADGTLWRFSTGPRDPSPLAVGVTAADVDAAGDVFGLVNGDLLRWAPGQTAAALLNNGSAGSPGDVVSFQVGNNTVAWMLGYQDANLAKIFVSYTSGGSPSLVTDSNGGGLLGVYDVAADGSVIVADPGAATNFGVTLLAAGGFNVDTAGTDIHVDGVAHVGTSFQLSPDGRAIAVLDSASGNLSAYTIAGNAVGPEQELVTTGTANSFGIANDLKVYEFTTGGDLRFYDPFAATPVLTPTLVGSSVAQYQLGPNGQVAYLTQADAFNVGVHSIANVAQIGFAPNGQLYYLDATGGLFRGVGKTSKTGGAYGFSRIDSNSTAFAVNNVGALVDIRSNGDVWRLTGRAGKLPALNSKKTVVGGWTKLFTGANLGTTVGSQQPGISTGTALFVLPDGNFFFLVNQDLIQLSANRSLILASGQTDIDWESDPGTNAGVSANVPSFNPVLGAGTFFSVLIGAGVSPFPLSLV
jgi:hypothetical protein